MLKSGQRTVMGLPRGAGFVRNPRMNMTVAASGFWLICMAVRRMNWSSAALTSSRICCTAAPWVAICARATGLECWCRFPTTFTAANWPPNR